MTSEKRFHDKLIIITGAGGNFGREGCAYFARNGARIAALDKNESALEETVSIVKNEGAKNIKAFECDVTSVASVESALDEIIRQFGTCPDLLWNNAGYQGQIKPTLEYSVDDFALVMNINVNGMFIMMQSVAKRMAAQNIDKNNKDDQKPYKYSIVNTASVAALRGTPAMIAYSSSKAAIISMTVCAAKDLAPHGIRVNAVSPALIGPGYMWTRQNELHAASNSPYFSSDPEEVAKNKVNGVPMKRLGTIEEVVKSVAFLLSDESSYTTAFNLVVDGGLSGGIH